MKPKAVHILFLIIALPIWCKANRDSVLLLTLDLPTKNKEGKIIQRLNYQIPHSGIYSVRLLCSQIRAKDTLIVYDLEFEKINFADTLGFIDLHLSQSKTAHQISADYSDIITRFDMVPAGQYISQITLRPIKQTEANIQQSIYQDVDSNLSYSSGLKDKVNTAMLLPQNTQQKLRNKTNQNKSQTTSPDQIATSNSKLQRKLRSIKGLQIQPIIINNQAYSALYYKTFFLGRYPLASAKEMSNKAANEIQAINNNASSLVNNELEGYRSVSSQVKDLFAKTDKNNQVKANIDLNSFSSTAQDPNTAVDKDYTEVLGNIETCILGLPISVEAFYTTQDQHRQAKASYIRFHYDINTAKNKLQNQINTYKSKLGETASKGKGLENIYQNYTQQLEGQKTDLLHNLSKEYEIDPKTISDNKGDVNKIVNTLNEQIDTAALKNQATDKLQSKATNNKTAMSLSEKKAKLMKDKKEIQERYQKIQALEQKINKYYSLLEKYRNQTHLDSALNYQKLNSISNKDASYKDMSKAAAGILPEGKAKHFITGLTNFDVGIINQYQSDYTMAGQTMKGVSFGYDLGLLKTSIATGNTEYITREGNVDRYTSYLGRIDLKEFNHQKIGFIYNGYSPTQSMMTDNNFVGTKGISYPSFRTPTHIFSLLYDGTIANNLLLHTEIANSFKGTPSQSDIDLQHSAIKANADYLIPKTTIQVKAEWEHLGKTFENSALPYIRSATERYTFGTAFDLFQSFLSLKIDYNYLMQQSFASTAYSTKWGFDIRTHSKRYPTIALAYKPFSTFRTLSDTLAIAQRPMLGEIWIGRASYQYKHYKTTHRFTALYNRNNSQNDTNQYTSNTLQLNYQYSNPHISFGLNAAKIELPQNFADGTGLITSYIFGGNIEKTIAQKITLNLTQDIATCTWGLQRIATSIGVAYRLTKIPIALRARMRYTQYKQKADDNPTTIYTGQIGISWHFIANKNKYPHRKNNKT